MLARGLFRLARWSPMGPAVALGLRYAGRWLPLRRVWWSPDLIGFYHPRPSWREHILLVPTTPIHDLLTLGQPGCAPLFAEIVLAAGEVLRRSGAGAGPYVLCANGGLRQDVQQVHFHLLPGERWVAPVANPGQAPRLLAAADWEVLQHPRPAWQTHLVLVPHPDLPPLLGLGREHTGRLAGLAAAVPLLHHQLALGPAGYTMLIQGEAGQEQPLQLQLIAGDQLSLASEHANGDARGSSSA